MNKQERILFAKKFDQLFEEQNLRDPNAARDFLKAMNIKGMSDLTMTGLRAQIDDLTDAEVHQLIDELGQVK